MRSAPLLLAPWFLCLVSSCTTRLYLDEPYEGPPATAPAGPYRLAPGDQIELEFARTFIPVDTYTLGVGDQLDIKVHGHPELDLSTAVGPDGNVSFLRVGVVKAAGKTLAELESYLTEQLAGPTKYVNPEVTAFLVQGDVQTERFVSMLLNSPTGSTRQATVSGDGHVAVPGVGLVEVASMTLSEAQDFINGKLRAVYPSVQVLASVKSVANARYSVVGEVVQPGTFSLTGTVTLLQALATARWETEYGDLSRVLVMTPTADNFVEARTYDVDESLAHGNPLPQILIRPGDTVLVLPTGVGNTNRAVEHYIRRHLPVNVGVGYRLNSN